MHLPRAAAIMGLADGMTTGIGLALGMALHWPHLAIWSAGLSGGLSAFPGMASGRYQSDPAEGKFAAVVCGLATTFGSIAVSLPFLLLADPMALVIAGVVAAVLCAVVAIIRPDTGPKAWALSYGITAAAAVLTFAASLGTG